MPERGVSSCTYNAEADDGHVIAKASAGRALRALQIGVAHRHDDGRFPVPVGTAQVGLQSSSHILLEPPTGVSLMGPSQPVQSFLCCFSRSEEGTAFLEDVSSKGWSVAVSLSAGKLLGMFAFGADGSYSSTATHHSERVSMATRKHRQVCFMHCLFVPKKSFQIPASKMLLSQDALALASHIHSHKTAGDFMQAYHSHVSQGLYHLGGIFYHELIVESDEGTTFQRLLEASSTQIRASFGLSVPLIGGGVKASGHRDVFGRSESEQRASFKVETVKEQVIALGLTSPVADANEFRNKLDNDPLSWAIIDKEPERADSLVSVWEIILAQPMSVLSSRGYDPELLKQAALYLSNHWQDEFSCRPGMQPNILSQLLSRNSALMHTLVTAGRSQSAALHPSSSFMIRPLPRKLPVAKLAEHLQSLLGPDQLADAGNSSDAAVQAIKACIGQLQLEGNKPSMVPESDEKMLGIIMGYGFDGSGNLPDGSLSPLQLRSLIDDLQKSQITPPAQPQVLPDGDHDSWPSGAVVRTCNPPLSEDILRSDVPIKYVGDVVVDRPFLQEPARSSDCGTHDLYTIQARHLLDCLRHRTDPLQHLSQIRGQGCAESVFTDDSWCDDSEEEHKQGTCPPCVSLFDLLVQLLRSSDLPSQVALFKLLLEQRAAVPLVLTDVSSARDVPMKHYAQALSFVQVKLPNEEKVLVTDDVQLPRVVFLSNREASESGAAIVASKALSCNFMSQYNRADMVCCLDAPVVEVGLGFVRPGQGQAQPLPCLAFQVNGRWDHLSIRNFVCATADVIIVELRSEEDAQECSNIVKQTENFLRHVLGKLRVQEHDDDRHRRQGILKVLITHFAPNKLLRFEQQEQKLLSCQFATAKEGLPLQDSFSREARIRFELLKLKHSPAESRTKENSCQKERETRKSKIEEVMRNPLVQVFHDLLSMKGPTLRRVGMMWLESAIAGKMQPLMSEAARAKDASFKEWQRDLSSVYLRAAHLRAKKDYVDKMLGIGNLWRELCHIFAASPKRHRNLATLAAQHLLDAFPMEILDGDAGMYCKEWVETVLAELHMLTTEVLHNRPARIFVLSVMGLQSSGKSTLLNLMFGTQLHTSAGRCTRGVYIQLVKSERPEYDYVLLLDTEGIRSPEFHGLQDSQIRDNRLATFGLLPADASIFMVSNEDDTGLKEVLPMVLLAFKGSAIAESYGGRIRSKLLFLYRSVDLNDKTKLKENKEKLQEHLRQAAEDVANMNLNRKTSSMGSGPAEADDDEERLMAAATGNLLRSMFNEGLCVDDDDEKSDVKCMGNLKRGHLPPDDVPEWAYGEHVVKIREFIHRRVTSEEGWVAKGLLEWSNYLSMVWECICKADFDLSFKTAVEVNAYKELQKSLATGPRLELSKNFMEEFECMETQVRSMKEGDDASSIHTVFENKVEEAMQTITAEVRRMLSNSMWRQWKAQEQTKWDLFCTSLREDYKRRLDDMISGVLKFDNVVSNYEKKMKREIVELIEAGKLRPEERDAVFEDIFTRIIKEAESSHEPFAQRVPSSVKKAYGTMSDLTSRFDLLTPPRHEIAQTEQPSTAMVGSPAPANSSIHTSRGGFLTGAVRRAVEFSQSIFPYSRPTQHADGGQSSAALPDKRRLMRSKLDAIVDSQLTNVKKYDELVVNNVIQKTTSMLERCGSRGEQEEGHRWVMHTLTEKLQKIQQHWDSEHNVAERLKAAKQNLRAFFDDRANGVGAANMLISELQRVLEDQLLASHHDLLVAAVVENLGNKNWLINWEAMRACLDLHLLICIEKNRIHELLSSVADGNGHFLLVSNALVASEIIRLYKVEWEVFFKKVQRCLSDASEQVGKSTGEGTPASAKIFLEELRHLLATRQVDPSARLASGTVSRIYHEQYNELDGDFFSTKVPQLCERLQERFREQGRALEVGEACGNDGALLTDLIRKVGERMMQLKDERVTPRCQESCPHCRITCFRAAGHVDRHDTVHQPAGLSGMIYERSSHLAETSCWSSLEKGDRFKYEGEWKSYKDFEKVYPSWLNPSNHDTTSTQVREYIFYTYQAELAAHFTRPARECKACPADTMPPHYAHSMEALYNTLQNRLNNSYPVVAETLQKL